MMEFQDGLSETFKWRFLSPS